MFCPFEPLWAEDWRIGRRARRHCLGKTRFVNPLQCKLGAKEGVLDGLILGGAGTRNPGATRNILVCRFDA